MSNAILDGKIAPNTPPKVIRSTFSAGIINKYVALVDPGKLNMGFTVFVRVWLESQDEDTTTSFYEAAMKLPQVMECHLMAGDCDFFLRVVAPDLDGYRQFQIRHLGRLKGVRNIKTEIPMQKIKQTWEIPL